VDNRDDVIGEKRIRRRDGGGGIVEGGDRKLDIREWNGRL
jgi:hypothetical protein